MSTRVLHYVDGDTFGGTEQSLLQLGIPRTGASPLRLLTWMVHSFSEYRSLSADVGGRPSAERLQSGLFLALWREELRAAAAH